MAQLARIFHQIFGAGGTSDNFGKFGSAKTGVAVTTKDLPTIMALGAWDTGWQDAVVGANKAPTLEEMNSHMFVHSTQMGYLFQSGIPEYDPSTTYYIGSVVRVGMYQYSSLTDNNLGNTPPAAASDANWLWTNQPGMPSGAMVDFGGYTAPAGWALCDNGTDTRAAQAALFAAITVLKNGTTSNGSPIITAIGTTAGLGVGNFVEGVGIPAGSKILTVDGGSQITLDQNCSASATVSIRFSPWGLGDGATTFNRPDFRRRVAYGAGSGVTVGASGGVESVQLTAAQSGLPAHLHSGGATPVTAIPSGGATYPGWGAANTGTTGGTSASASHTNMMPYGVALKIVKY